MQFLDDHAKYFTPDWYVENEGNIFFWVIWFTFGKTQLNWIICKEQLNPFQPLTWVWGPNSTLFNSKVGSKEFSFVYLEGKQFPIVFSRSNKTHCETSTLLYIRNIVSASQYDIVSDCHFTLYWKNLLSYLSLSSRLR